MADKEEGDVKEVTTEVVDEVAPNAEIKQENSEKTSDTNVEENDKQQTVVKNKKKIAPKTEVDQENSEKIADTNVEENEGQQAVVEDKKKIDILLKATGNAPIMKKKRWAVNHDQHIGWISEFIKRYLKLDAHERLFLYINQAFAPAPDQTVQNLYECYGSDGKLVIHYCKSQAWG